MEWVVTYLGQTEVTDIHVTLGAPRPDLKEEIQSASKLIRKNKKEQKDGNSVMRISLENQIALVATGDGSPIYQPISKVLGAAAHKEGAIRAIWYFSYIYCDEDTLEGSPNAVYYARTFKVKGGEDDAMSVEFATCRTMALMARRGRPSEKPVNEWGLDEYENAVAWWNAGTIPKYHYRLARSDNGACTVSGVIKFELRVEADDAHDDQHHHLTKMVQIKSDLHGNELVLLLGDKFNQANVQFSTHAVCDCRHGEQEPRILDEMENPILRSFSWKDPSEGTFALRKLPVGLQRASIEAAEQSADRSDIDSPAAPSNPTESSPSDVADLNEALGPLLPYCEEDEDLLLLVMITKQSGTGLGFKLTPSYLLQMCIAFSFLHRPPSALNRLLTKITSCIRQVMEDNSDNIELLLFWCCNTLRLLDCVGSRHDLMSAYTAAVGSGLEDTLTIGLKMIIAAGQAGASALPPPLSDSALADGIEGLQKVVTEHYQSLDSNMSRANLQEVVERITSAMPSAHIRQKNLALAENGMLNTSSVTEDTPDTPVRSKRQHAAASVRQERPGIDPLPEEWEELVDQETKHRFFANHLTRQTSWTDPRDRLTTVTLTKGAKGLGVGLSGAKRTWDGRLILGIFVSSLVMGSAAAEDGTLNEGDEILEVDNHSLIGVNREGAIDHLRQVPNGGSVTLLVSQEPETWVDPDRVKAELKHTAL